MNTLTEFQMTPRPDPEQMTRPVDFGKIPGGEDKERTETDKLAAAIDAGIQEYNDVTKRNFHFMPVPPNMARALKMFILGALYPPQP